MNRVIIGTAAGKPVGFDIQILLATRLLLQAGSGGGKSWALRLLMEKIFGRVQVIVIDPEGEFSTLREKFPYVLVGKGGETPADPRSAGMLAHRLLELQASAVCDLYELKSGQRHAFVRVFLDSLLEAPKELRTPVIVVVDEAHMFCPEKGESEAYGSMVDLCTRGRKRGLCPLFATQRLSALAKDASSQLQNRLIGPTFEDIDRKRCAEILGVPKGSDERAFMRELQLLPPGNFFALGRAISTERILVKIGEIQTTHPKAFTKHTTPPPPAPEKIKALLPKLADLPKEAEEKSRTEAELRIEIRTLKAELTKAKSHAPAGFDQKTVDRAVASAVRPYVDRMNLVRKNFEMAQRALTACAGSLELPAGTPKPAPAGEGGRVLKYANPDPPAPHVVSHVVPSSAESNGALPLGERAILTACAQFGELDRDQLTTLAGYKRSSRDAYIGRLIGKGYVADAGRGRVRVTDEGIAALGSNFEPLPTGNELLEWWRRRLPDGELKLLNAVVDHGGLEVARDSLDSAGFKRSSRDAYLGRLYSRRLVEFPRAGYVAAAKSLFD
jgi:hypothetical protein